MSKAEKNYPSWFPKEVRAETVKRDDPDALPKLQARLAYLEHRHGLMVATNSIIRWKASEVEKVVELMALGYASDAIPAILAPTEAGFSSAMVSQSGAEIRRLGKRIEEAKAKATLLAEQAVLARFAAGYSILSSANGRSWWKEWESNIPLTDDEARTVVEMVAAGKLAHLSQYDILVAQGLKHELDAELDVKSWLTLGARVEVMGGEWWWLYGDYPPRLVSDAQRGALKQLAHRGLVKDTWSPRVQMPLF
jgi:hypothetical protein